MVRRQLPLWPGSCWGPGAHGPDSRGPPDGGLGGMVLGVGPELHRPERGAPLPSSAGRVHKHLCPEENYWLSANTLMLVVTF